jgi:N-acetylmuramoyl-L-alanine amidase
MNVKNIIQKIISFFISLLHVSDGQEPDENPAQPDAQDKEDENETDSNDSSNNGSIFPENTENTETETENPINTEMNNYAKLMVHLDNGHGKATPGKRSPSATTGKGYGTYTKDQLSLYEYEYNRLIVKLVDEKLRQLGFKTFIVTPEVEGDIGLTARALRSNNMAGRNPGLKHIFISAHVNAIGDGKTWYTGSNGSYWCAYTSKGQTGGDKLADCFYDAAEEVLKPFKKKIKTDLSDGDRDVEENFTVITKTTSPAVLVESLFMTNVDDVLFLKSDVGTNAIVDIYVKACIKYAERYVK